MRLNIAYTLIYCWLILGSCMVQKKKIVSEKHINKSKCESEVIDINKLPLKSFNQQNIAVLRRYLLGNPKWEIQKTMGAEYAILYKNARKREQSELLNSRTIISFGSVITDDENSVYITTNKNKVNGISNIERQNGLKIHSSNLVIGSELINIEILEKSKSKARTYTNEAISVLIDELNEVLLNESKIEEYGILDELKFYPIVFDSSFFSITKSFDENIYTLEGAFQINEPGVIYVKAFESKTGTPLSKKWLVNSSTKDMGWSNYSDKYFYYKSDVKFYEYAHSGPYKAIIELWFRNTNSHEKVLARKTSLINGWDRKNSVKNNKQVQ